MLADFLKRLYPELLFTLFDVGALPLEGQQEVTYSLIEKFPGSRMICFEVDEELCASLRKQSQAGFEFYPVALGRANEERPFYITNDSMCCSLYKPNTSLLQLYNGLDYALLKSVSSLRTTSLDSFLTENQIGPVDFIKIDIQGAELDVFEGGTKGLEDVLGIVCEVEFVPLYENQPLFGDVAKYLAEQNFLFCKFGGIAGRTLQPIIIKQNVNYPGNHLWADALFFKHPSQLPRLSDGQLLKLAILTDLFHLPDYAYLCLKAFDQRKDSSLAYLYHS